MEQEKKREYMERLTLEFLAYDDKAVGAAIKCFLSGTAPDNLDSNAFNAFTTISEIKTLIADY